MTGPLHLAGPLSGMILGFGFGFILENAGFGDPQKLTGQLRLTDWAVFRVMFTAIIVCGVLLSMASGLGLINLGAIFIPSVYFWGTLLGGAGLGIGMAVGGYCPGTAIVGLVSGRLDGLVFVLGVGAGTLLFNGAYPSIKSWAYAKTGPTALTLPQLLHLPTWLILLLLLAVLVGVGWLTAGAGGRNRPSVGQGRPSPAE
jgi:uncharacterized protein